MGLPSPLYWNFLQMICVSILTCVSTRGELGYLPQFKGLLLAWSPCFGSTVQDSKSLRSSCLCTQLWGHRLRLPHSAVLWVPKFELRASCLSSEHFLYPRFIFPVMLRSVVWDRVSRWDLSLTNWLDWLANKFQVIYFFFSRAKVTGVRHHTQLLRWALGMLMQELYWLSHLPSSLRQTDRQTDTHARTHTSACVWMFCFRLARWLNS